jgi:hypothetical protein
MLGADAFEKALVSFLDSHIVRTIAEEMSRRAKRWQTMRAGQTEVRPGPARLRQFLLCGTALWDKPSAARGIG